MSEEAEPVVIYVVYDRPRDCPDDFVCRRTFVRGSATTVETTLFRRYPTIGEMEACLRKMGLTKLEPMEGDDPVIVATWI